MGSTGQVRVPRSRFGVWWVRVRYGQRTAERHLDVLAYKSPGWAQVKMYAESPPVLWVYPEGAKGAAVSVAAVRVGGRWVFQRGDLPRQWRSSIRVGSGEFAVNARRSQR